MGFFQRLLARMGYVKVQNYGLRMTNTGHLVPVNGNSGTGTSVYTQGSAGRGAPAPLSSWTGAWDPMAAGTPMPEQHSAPASLSNYPPLGAYGSPSKRAQSSTDLIPRSSRPPGVPASRPAPGMGLNDLLMGKPSPAPAPAPVQAFGPTPVASPAPVSADLLAQTLSDLDESADFTVVSRNDFAERAAEQKRRPQARFLGSSEAQCTVAVPTEMARLAMASKG